MSPEESTNRTRLFPTERARELYPPEFIKEGLNIADVAQRVRRAFSRIIDPY
jgi:hypothetical protein